MEGRQAKIQKIKGEKNGQTRGAEQRPEKQSFLAISTSSA